MLGAERGEDVLLRVIQVGLQVETGIGFFVWNGGGAEVDTEPFLAELDEDALG